ncbi:flagellar FlbD family protein [Selenihalanaerobacter shriftii]|uniref:Flagellar protein FlbD n=1 Tax=Selenihalanaerobacter shriftii TaxID=142842 RepID=A0A1T4MC63_9FIRM|nr:flagellar protein FlbD [Selenihalanaerobacter shriftii]
MIEVTKLNGKVLVINCELIELIESTPDTIISLTTGRKIVVQEGSELIIGRVIKYKQEINKGFE